MKTFPRFLILAIATASFAGSCKSSDPVDVLDACGPIHTWKSEGMTVTVSEEDGKTLIIEEDLGTPSRICAAEHAQVRYKSTLRAGVAKPADMAISGYAYWGGKQTTVLSSTSATTYAGSDNIGLKQFFGEKPGFVGLQVRYSFPTRGSVTKDEAYFDSIVEKSEIELDWYEHKD